MIVAADHIGIAADSVARSISPNWPIQIVENVDQLEQDKLDCWIGRNVQLETIPRAPV